jgi:hypothetical protein
MTHIVEARRFTPSGASENGKRSPQRADLFRIVTPKPDLELQDRKARLEELFHPTTKLTRADVKRDPIGDPAVMTRELGDGFRDAGERLPTQLAMDVAGILTLVNVHQGEKPQGKGKRLPTPPEQYLSKVTKICAEPDQYPEFHTRVTKLLDRKPGTPWEPLTKVVEDNLLLAKAIVAEVVNAPILGATNEKVAVATSSKAITVYASPAVEMSSPARPESSRRLGRRVLAAASFLR